MMRFWNLFQSSTLFRTCVVVVALGAYSLAPSFSKEAIMKREAEKTAKNLTKEAQKAAESVAGILKKTLEEANRR